MAVQLTKRVNYSANERLDLNDKLAEGELSDEALHEYLKQLVIGDGVQGRVFRGFKSTTVVGPNVGFTIPASQGVAVTSDGEVCLMDGSTALTDTLLSNSIHYFHLHFDEDTTDNATRRFYSGGTEVSTLTDTRITRTASLYRTTTAYGTPTLGGFSTSAMIGGKARQLIPLYAVRVDGSNAVDLITDYRPMFAPNINGAGSNAYTADSHSFGPSDAATIGIIDVRQALVAITDRIKQLKGTTNWWDTSVYTLADFAISGWTHASPVIRLTTITDQVGIGTATPNANVKLHVVHDNLPIRSERTTATTNASQTVVGLLTTCTADMVDGFGSGVSFNIQDTAAVVNPIANIFGVRYGADNSGRLSFYTYNAGTGTEKMSILPDGKVGMGISVPTQPLHVIGKILSSVSGGLGGFAASTAVDGMAILDLYGDAGGSDSSISLRWQQTTFQSNTLVWRFRLGGTTPNAFMVGWFDGVPVLTVKQTGIGILTPTPVNALDVEGAVAIGAAYSGTSTAPTNGLLVEGSIGIGTASVSANAKVDLTRADASTTIAGLEIAQDATGDALLRFALSTARGWSLGVDNSDGDKFKIGTAANATSGVDTGTAFTIDPATGFVGVGSTTPTLPLTVKGTTTNAGKLEREFASTNVQAAPLYLLTTSTADMVDGIGTGVAFAIQDNALVQNTIGYIFCDRAGADNSGTMKFYTFNAGVNTEKMRISSNGYVGIGTAADAQVPLHVFVNDVSGVVPASAILGLEKNDDAHLSFLSSNAAGKTAGLLFGDATNGAIGSLLYKHDVDAMTFTTNGAERMRLSSSGYLGIGVSPSMPLDVLTSLTGLITQIKSTTGSSYIGVDLNHADTVRSTWQASVGSGAAYLTTETAHPLIFRTTGTDRMRILASGEIGIGTSTIADATLVVNQLAGNTVASFGSSLPVYVVAASPTLGFNSYYNGSWRYGKGAAGHYAATLGFDPSTAEMYWDASAASGTYGGVATLSRLLSLNAQRMRTSSPHHIKDWGSSSAHGGGAGMFASNAYYNPIDTTYRFTNTHASIGACGMTPNAPNWNQIGWFVQGTASSTADATFTSQYRMLLSATEFWVEPGAVFGTPTGGNKGAGTINAQAVYDDNVLLTCYVIEKFNTGTIDLAKWDKTINGTAFVHKAARRFLEVADEELDVVKYAEKWRRLGYLPALPSPEEWARNGNSMSVGKLVQGLWETVEVQAAHIKQLNDRLTRIEAILLNRALQA